ncbi:sensor histidine kinase [Nonomuraea sp. NPDC004580]|uniref:sensor histidine kinase n=1 Tax=Nonomuraea sp. NPDC004580 TaxID=3154552 RepID=UPI0033AFC4C4
MTSPDAPGPRTPPDGPQPRTPPLGGGSEPRTTLAGGGFESRTPPPGGGSESRRPPAGGQGRERWVFAALAYALLAVSSLVTALAEPGGAPDADAGTTLGLPSWLAGPLAAGTAQGPLSSVEAVWGSVPWPFLAVVAAVWLAPVAWLHPVRERQRALVVGHVLVLLAIAAGLTLKAPAFIVFASIGYPLTIAMFPARLVMAGVTLTALVNVAVQAGPGARDTLLAVLAGVALPLVAAGWYVSAEHDKRRRLVQRLRAAMEENAELNARLLDQARRAGVADERHRVAGEIHDTLAQDLVALIGQLDAAGHTARGPAREHLDRAAALARRGLAETRRSITALRPEPLERTDLPQALHHMARSWAETAGVDLRFEITGTPVALAADVESALFRIAQEALANVAKHANATRTGLTLTYTDELILLDIRDDGLGFPPQRPTDGFGLDSMRRRAGALGGTLTVESEPGRGTAVAAAVPAIPPTTSDRRR